MQHLVEDITGGTVYFFTGRLGWQIRVFLTEGRWVGKQNWLFHVPSLKLT